MISKLAMKVTLALLGLLLLAASAFAFSDYTVKSITSQAAARVFVNSSFDDLVRNTTPYVQQFDGTVAAGFDFNCTLSFQSSVDTVVR